MRTRMISAALIVSLLFGWGTSAIAAPGADWAIENGRFFTQTSGNPGTGYAVTNDNDVPFWSEIRRLGGVDALGYPVSNRFTWRGFISQATQRVIFQWRPEVGKVYFVNVFDLLSEAGLDDWLLVTRQVPKPAILSESGKTWDEIISARLALLEERPAIRAKYFSVVGDPIAMNGLPTSRVIDMGNHHALRAQRVVLQEWKEDVPWAKKGQVTVALGGSIAREVGLIPDAAIIPQAAPPAADDDLVQDEESVFATRQVVSLYGFPGVPVLGALGEQGLEATVARAQRQAASVDARNGELGAQPAFHIITTIAHPSPVPGYLDKAVLEEYIEAAGRNGLLVFIDLQIAGSRLEDEIARVLPYLRNSFVHLAIDPEFATRFPGEVIGSLDATDINAAQQQVSDYLEQNGIAGRKILIVHQFDESMITRKHLLQDYPRIDLVIDADGVGGKEAKISDYIDYAAHPTLEYLGFKIFLLHDVPPMTVDEVLALEPMPNVIIYQ